MSPDDREQADYVSSWRAQYDAAREMRSVSAWVWGGCTMAVAFLVSPEWWPWYRSAALGFVALFGGYSLVMFGHYQDRCVTMFSALKGTRDEPPRDELAARRRR